MRTIVPGAPLIKRRAQRINLRPQPAPETRLPPATSPTRPTGCAARVYCWNGSIDYQPTRNPPRASATSHSQRCDDRSHPECRRQRPFHLADECARCGASCLEPVTAEPFAAVVTTAPSACSSAPALPPRPSPSSTAALVPEDRLSHSVWGAWLRSMVECGIQARRPPKWKIENSGRRNEISVIWSCPRRDSLDRPSAYRKPTRSRGLMVIPKLNLIAAIGLALGAGFGLAGTLVGQPHLQQILWAIDAAGLVMATSLLSLKFFRKGNDLVAAGFLVFALGESVLLSGPRRAPPAAFPRSQPEPPCGRPRSFWSASPGSFHWQCGRSASLPRSCSSSRRSGSSGVSRCCRRHRPCPSLPTLSWF